MLGLKLKLKIRQHLRTRTRMNVKFITVTIVFALLYGITVTSLILLNLNNPEKGVATTPGNDNLSSGDIICRFTWDNNAVTKATEGPDAISISSTVTISCGGRSSTDALNPG